MAYGEITPTQAADLFRTYMEGRSDLYKELNANWDWASLQFEATGYLADQVAEMIASGEDIVPDDLCASVFIGSVFSLAPSGKYYTPYACSNLDPCPSCDGTGHSRRSRVLCPTCKGVGERLVEDYMNPEWLASMGKAIGDTFPCNVCNGLGTVPRQCSRCGGLGSAEAYQDQIYYETLDKVAEAHGAWIGSGEGDPCDLTAGWAWDTVLAELTSILAERGIVLADYLD